ncbi:MAG: hypothetical protein ACKO0Z_13040 [Betaproteobacteria bacterium]
MHKDSQEKPLEMQPALLDAAIDILNGMSLMDSYRKHRANITIGKAKKIKPLDGTCKDIKGCVDPAYGVIRSSVMRLCAHRNSRKYEELRDRDANKPKNSSKRSASDVSYETLQLYAHHFLTPAEMERFEDGQQERIEEIGLLSEKKESYLYAQHRALVGRIRRAERVLREGGVVRDGALLEIQGLLERLDSIDSRLIEHCEKLKAMVAVSKSGIRHQSLRKISEFEGRKR